MTNELDLEDIAPAQPDDNAQDVAVDDSQDKLPKSTVSKIVERERQKAFEKGRQEAMMEFQQSQQQQQQGQQPEMQQQSATSLGGMQNFAPADLDRMIAEKIPQALQGHVNEMRTQQLVDSFVSKMQAAEAKYPGLEAQLNDLDYSSMAPVVEMANNMENTADIMKELLDKPEKLSSILTLSYTQPRLAQRKLMDLSQSIKQNEDAKAQESQAKDPMSQLKPSSSAGMDNSAMSVSDFRKMFKT